MSGNVLAVLILIGAALPAWSAPPQDSIRDAIARGESLYFEAEFAKAIEVLLPIDELLANISGPTPEKINVKLHLALAYLGLSETERAKGYLRAVYAISPQHLLDPQQFPPKVLQMAEEARIEQVEGECKRLHTGARTELAAGNPGAVLQLLERNNAKCPALNAVLRETSELFFKNGLEAYRKSQLNEALDAFRAALRLDSENELATQYIELTQSKLNLDADRLFLAWRRNFDVGAFLLAANEYRRLLPVLRKETIDQINGEYRRTLSNLVEARARACARNDAAGVERLNAEARELLPDPSIAPNLMAMMGPCPNTSCVEMAAAAALVRLKTRVDPVIPLNARLRPGSEPITVQVKARISETGDVISVDAAGGNVAINAAVKEAVGLWKFHPAIVRDENRCVDTEIPVVLNFEAAQ